MSKGHPDLQQPQSSFPVGSGLPPNEAPVMIVEMRSLFLSCLFPPFFLSSFLFKLSWPPL